MKNELMKECQEALQELVGKKILDIKFEARNRDCWRFYIESDGGKFVMTFCQDWQCPVVEMRDR
ncbi:MAG: hypothetical protein BME94_00940 [Methanobacteriales archaeon Met13]